jgi:cytochrome P450
MVEQWLSSPNGKSNSVIKDTSTLALNVISAVAFENAEVNEPTPGHTLSLRDALVTVMSTSVSPAIEGVMPFLKLPILESLLPDNVKNLLLAMHEFRQYMDETVAQERRRTTSGQTMVAPLISTLVNANDQVKTESGVSKARLSDNELGGNIFIFTVGGLESTSVTLSYAIALLAVYPETQDWVMEELDEVLNDEANNDMEYARLFPRLKRVMAVMVGSVFSIALAIPTLQRLVEC